MPHRNILIVDDQPESLQTIAMTLDDAALPYTRVDSSDDAWITFQKTPTCTLVLARAFGNNISGTELCRRIRETKSPADVQVIIILREDELPAGAEALVAGASDLLIDPFEPRELRMRANIVPADQVQRIDQAHTLVEEDPSAAREPKFYIPEFDATTKRMTFGLLESRQHQWDNDPDVKKVALDQIIVCPECDAIPTFRQGCGACGSAWIEEEVLIHHYACAHVGPESEFQTSSGLTCPKCRLRNLVAGSDFEQIKGCLRCTDCAAVFGDSKMIGHCLSCEHRFPAEEGRVKSLYGYQVGRSPDAAVVSAPSYHTMSARNRQTIAEY